MIPFFKKKADKPKAEGRESIVPSNELLEGVDIEDSTEEVVTELSLHPSWNLNKEDVYVYQFLNLECPPLNPNQLSLYGINISKESESLKITAFVRNSLSKAVKLSDTTLVLLNNDDKVLGRKAFDLTELGEVPAKSSRPWEFIFTTKDLFSDEIPANGWKLAFQLSPSSRKHSLELEDSWNKSLASEDKEKLKDLVNKIEPPKAGEVNFMGLNARLADTGDLHITMLVRNGSDKTLNLEQIPLQVEDASGDIVAKGGFKLDEFKVSANTSKPWTFIFPKSLVLKTDLDLSKWKAYPPKKN